jgi:hypothetical protein
LPYIKLKKMKKLYFLIAILATSMSFGQAFTATYDFAAITASSTQGTTDPTPVPTAPGVTFGSFHVVNPNLGTGVTGSSGAGRFSFPNQPVGSTNGSDDFATMTGALDPAVYYEVVLTPSAALNLSSITFRSQRSGTGIRNYAVRSSIDGYASNLAASIEANPNVSVLAGNAFGWTLDSFTQGVNGNTITLGGAPFTGINSPVTLRFYAWNAEGTGGNFSIDDVIINGSTGALAVNQNAIAGLQVYPNPVTNGNLYITSDSNESKAIVIYDVLGKVVVKASVNDQAVNVSNLKGGVYIVKITEAGKTATRKLVIR